MHVRKPRKQHRIRVVKLGYPRPIAGKQRLDNEQILPVVSRMPGAIFQEAVACQAPDQDIQLLGRAPASRAGRGERQARCKLLRGMPRRRAERPQTDCIVFPAGDDGPVRMGLQLAPAVEPGGQARMLRFRSRCHGSLLKYEGISD